MRGHFLTNMDYSLIGRAAVRQHTRPQLPDRAIPRLPSFRVYFDPAEPHIARLSRRDAPLETALRTRGFTIPTLDADQDRR